MFYTLTIFFKKKTVCQVLVLGALSTNFTSNGNTIE